MTMPGAHRVAAKPRGHWARLNSTAITQPDEQAEEPVVEPSEEADEEAPDQQEMLGNDDDDEDAEGIAGCLESACVACVSHLSICACPSSRCVC